MPNGTVLSSVSSGTALNSVPEGNSENNNNNEVPDPNASAESQATWPQRGSMTGINSAGHYLKQGSHVLYKRKPSPVYTIESILGGAETPIQNRRIMIGVAESDGTFSSKTRLIPAASKNLTYTEEGLRRSSRLKPKGGRRNITRKKNRTL